MKKLYLFSIAMIASFPLSAADDATESTENTKTTFNFAKISESYPETDWSADGTNKYINVTGTEFTSDGFTLVATKGSSTEARLYETSGVIDLRVYKTTGTMTVTAPDGYYLTEVIATSSKANSVCRIQNITAPEAEWTVAKAVAADMPSGQKTGVVCIPAVDKKNTSITLTAASYNTRIELVICKAEKIKSGIETVTAEGEDQPVEYFDMNGIRVAEPQNGLFIKRQGSKATKVIVK